MVSRVQITKMFECIAVIVATIATLTCTALIYFKWVYSYWARKKLPFIEPRIPFGNLSNYLTNPKSRGLEYQELYNECKKRGYKHAGVFAFTRPVYLPVDPDYIKNVLINDFQHFVDRGVFYNEKHQPISAHLFALGGTKWRNLRVKLSPSFTSGKIKMMFPLVVQCTKSMKEAVNALLGKNEPIDVKEICASYTTDVIGTCAFGLDCNSQKNSEIRKAGRALFPAHILMAVKLSFSFAFQNLAGLLGLVPFDKEAGEFFSGTVEETVKYREENKITRQDFLQLLVDLKNADGITMDELKAQCFVFFIAGFETSSSPITLSLCEMAVNQEVQDKAREEIKEMLKRHNGEITYDGILELKYVQQVIDETLRKYPPLPFITRKCVKDYKIPNTDVTLKNGTAVAFSIVGIHHDPEYYPDPDKFDPERFSDENKQKRKQMNFIPFGEGPRICIGLRFGLLVVKICLCELLMNYRFVSNPKTKMPLQMDFSRITAIKGGVWVDAVKID